MKGRWKIVGVASSISVCVLLHNPLYSPSSRVFGVTTKMQFGNAINGFVFGLQRQPLSDINVELLDDLSRTVARTLTSASGRYTFNGIRAGRYSIRVMPRSADYEEQVQEVEIVNFQHSTISGGARTSGFENRQQDFYLKIRRNKNVNEVTGTIFIQDVPEQAKKIYEKGLVALENKKDEEAIGNFKAAVDLFPEYYAALERIGTEYIRLNQLSKAEEALNKAVVINQRGYRSMYGLAYAYYRSKQNQKAVDAARKSVQMLPASIEAILLYGVVLKQSGSYLDAETQLKKADELSKGMVAEAHWHLALLYGNNLKRYKEAADRLELFLKVQPNSRDKASIDKLIKIFREKSLGGQ